MNPRIKSLAEEANILRYRKHYDPTFSQILENREEVDKFAELIVRECAGLFANVYVTVETDHGHASVIASDHILKHFGVK